MGERTQHEAHVAATFAQHSGYTAPAVGDKVAISGDYEVAAATANDFVIGEVFALNPASGNVAATVTVELRGQKIDRVVVDDAGNVAAGAYVAIAGPTSVATHTPAAGTSVITYGIALEAGLDTASIDVLVS